MYQAPLNPESTTYQMKSLAEARVASAMAYLTDAYKDKRVKDKECKACFYLCSSRIGGAACTTRPCAVCGEWNVFSGSTNIGAICDDCSDKHKLCTYCGGDILMRERRKEPYPQQTKAKPDPNELDDLFNGG